MIFRFDMTTAILVGTEGIDKLGEEAAKLGRKARHVTYPNIHHIGLLNKVISDLKEKGVEAIVFEKVKPNPRTTTIDEGAKIARKEKIDLLIGLGGGSVMDATKGIALASSGCVNLGLYVGAG